MANLVSLIKLPITGAYLNLNTSISTEVILNLDHIVSAEYNPNYPNGYGGTLSCLSLVTIRGKETFYRDDADEALKKIKPFLAKNFNDGIQSIAHDNRNRLW